MLAKFLQRHSGLPYIIHLASCSIDYYSGLRRCVDILYFDLSFLDGSSYFSSKYTYLLEKLSHVQWVAGLEQKLQSEPIHSPHRAICMPDYYQPALLFVHPHRQCAFLYCLPVGQLE